MSKAVIGLFAGLLLALAALVGGFWGLVLAIVFGLIGLVIGLQLDGALDLGAVIRSRGRG
ncbi:DUF2273 domain-containing protein [Gordonia sp. HY285]|uniref:DUF2273 domain-containing protein n=1 Tax=Gordonia liuliyuniae TaxID=2911517 RepID=A0ABS9IU03_9ACTN|nr:DUF2273 domain-containing protein [Gordonia liuliyuniae]MCF8589027.1 DUF2273 domain-containing protein [Gordonia liuliyuniae]MCF8609103.1 DUF2273 domain-containing protein [Gordonia liuliyuniae]